MRFTSILAVAAAAVVSGVQAQNFGGGVVFPIPLNLVKSITAYIDDIDYALATDTLNASFVAQNPVPFTFTVNTVSAKVGINGTTYAQFTKTFTPPLVLKPLGSIASPKFGPVALPQGAVATLGITNEKFVDIQSLTLKGSVFNVVRIPITLNNIVQKHVPITYVVG